MRLLASALIRDCRGVSIIAAVAMMSILGVFGLLVVTLTVTETETSLGYLTSLQAMEIAQAGMEKAIYQYKSGTACSSLSYTNSLGSGSFTTTGTPSGGSCLIQSTGTVGTGRKVLQATVSLSSSVASLDGNSTSVNTSETNIGSLSTTLPAGTNLIVVVVSFRDTSSTDDINAGNLKLKRGGSTLVSNQYIIRVGGGATPSSTVFPQETDFLVYRDTGVSANPTYDVTALASGAGISAEVKMVVISSVPNSSFQDGGSVTLNTSETTILSHATVLPAGTNMVIAAVQLDNTDSGASRRVDAGNLRLKKGGSTLASNQFRIDIARSTRANRETGFLLLYRDSGAAANPTYSITGLASASGDVTGEAKIIVLNGLTSAFLDSGSVVVGMSQTVIGSLATSFAAGQNVVITSNQYQTSNTRNVLAGNERIVESATTRASNQFDINICDSSTSQSCNDFADGLIWHQASGGANPAFDIRTQASGNGVDAETKILAIQAGSGGPVSLSSWQELY